LSCQKLFACAANWVKLGFGFGFGFGSVTGPFLPWTRSAATPTGI
jgi:hypothetical protein